MSDNALRSSGGDGNGCLTVVLLFLILLNVCTVSTNTRRIARALERSATAGAKR